MAKDRTKKGVLAALNPKNIGHYHFPSSKKAVIGSIYRNQQKARKKKGR